MSAPLLALGVMLLAAGPSGQQGQLREVRRAIVDADLHGDWDALVAARERALALPPTPELRGLADYEAAYADWRLSSLAYLGAGTELQVTLLLRAARELQAATAARPDLAEAHALLAWVSGLAVGTDRTRAAPLAPLIGPSWAAASKAVETNPRVALLRAMSTTFTPAGFGGDRVRGLAAWKAAIARFEERVPAPDEPQWGHAEALGWLGAAYLGAGQPAEAVPWLERALRVRPDFWWVKRIALPQARRFVLAASEAAVDGGTPRGSPGDEALRGIEELRRRDEAASKAHDLQALSALWTDDLVSLPAGGPVLRGPELRAQLPQLAAAAKNIEILDYRERFEETLVFGDTAVEWGHIEGKERDRSSGKVTQSRFHLMRVLKRVPDGSWRVHRSIFAPAG